MSSILQIEANRANGAKSHGPITEEGKRASAANSALSTGPRTPEGKARASKNGLDHGLLAQSIVLDEDDAEFFLQYMESIKDDLQPVGFLENYLVETVVVSEYRKIRAMCYEKGIYNAESHLKKMNPDVFLEQMNDAFPGTATAVAIGDLNDRSSRLRLFRRYEIGFARESARALRQFLALRDRRMQQNSIRTEPNLGEIRTPAEDQAA